MLDIFDSIDSHINCIASGKPAQENHSMCAPPLQELIKNHTPFTHNLHVF